MNIKQALEKYLGASIFDFGDSKELSDELLTLVRSGKKTATCAALRDYMSENEKLPVIGRRDIAVNYDDQSPALVIETIEVTQKRFCEVDEEFALQEGENETLTEWKRDHQAYFERNGDFDKDMMLVCEHFKLIEYFHH